MSEISGETANQTLLPVRGFPMADAFRHPSRSRQSYVPRGQLRPGSAALWGQQDRVPAWQRATATPRAVTPAPHPAQRKWLTIGGLAIASAGAFAIAIPVVNTFAPATPSTFFDTTAPQILPAVPVPTPPATASAPTAPAGTLPLAPVQTAPPPMPDAIVASDAFICETCTAPQPRFSGITVTVQGGAGQPQIAGQIAALGLDLAAQGGAGITVTRPQVRFYRTEDEAAAQALAERFAAVLVDVTWLAPTAPAKIDVLLPETPDTP